MRARIFQWCLFSLVVLTVMSARAQTADAFYQIALQVENQSESVRKLGVQNALQQLIVKVSGSATTLQNQGVREAFSNPYLFVRSYRYTKRDFDEALMLNVSFAGAQVERLLAKEGAPVWGRSRPKLLQWLAVEEGGRRTLINTTSRLWHGWMTQSMNDRGIPFRWPNLDAQDNNALSVSRLWGLFLEDIQAASARYPHDALLAGRIRKDASGRFSYSGFLLEQGERNALNATGEDIEEVLLALSNRVATILASRYAFSNSALSRGQEFELRVTGVTSLNAYRSLLDYLDRKVGIQQALPSQVNGDNVTVTLKLTSDPEPLLRAFALDKRLQPDETRANQWRWQTPE